MNKEKLERLLREQRVLTKYWREEWEMEHELYDHLIKKTVKAEQLQNEKEKVRNLKLFLL